MGLGVEGGDFVGDFDDSDLKQVTAWHNLKSRWGDDRPRGWRCKLVPVILIDNLMN